MDFILNYWFVIVGVIALFAFVTYAIYKFFGLPTKSQILKIKEWLLWAVIKAEKELGSGTGIVKLRFVYDLFVSRFPMVAKIISFELFSMWVDEALKRMELEFKKSDQVKSLVEGE